VRSKPQKTGEVCRDDSGTHDGVNGNKARQAYFARDLCVTQVPLRGWAGVRIWFCPDFPTNCVHELVTGHKGQLADEVHRCRMDWHGIRIWVVAFGPEEVCQKFGDRERRSDLLKLDRLTGQERNLAGVLKKEGPHRNAKEQNKEYNEQEWDL